MYHINKKPRLVSGVLVTNLLAKLLANIPTIETEVSCTQATNSHIL